MRRVLVALLALVLTVSAVLAVCAGPDAPPGPAPNSHDGIPDGPGWEDGQPGPFGPEGEPAGVTVSFT